MSSISSYWRPVGKQPIKIRILPVSTEPTMVDHYRLRSKQRLERYMSNPCGEIALTSDVNFCCLGDEEDETIKGIFPILFRD